MSPRHVSLLFFSALILAWTSVAFNGLVNPGSLGYGLVNPGSLDYRCRSRCTLGCLFGGRLTFATASHVCRFNEGPPWFTTFHFA